MKVELIDRRRKRIVCPQCFQFVDEIRLDSRAIGPAVRFGFHHPRRRLIWPLAEPNHSVTADDIQAAAKRYLIDPLALVLSNETIDEAVLLEALGLSPEAAQAP